MTTNLERAHALSERLVAARADHRRAEHALAVLLAELVADQLFRPLGYASVEEFAADRLGRVPQRSGPEALDGQAPDGRVGEGTPP